MRLVSWNCRKGLSGEKLKAVLTLDADLIVIQETRGDFSAREAAVTFDSIWIGDKGLGLTLMWKEPWEVRQLSEPLCKWVVPFQVQGPSSFFLMPVWNFNRRAATPPPYNQVHRATQVYRDLVQSGDWLFLGDFNSPWRPPGHPKHRRYIEAQESLKSIGLTSAYHEYFNEAPGSESLQTYFRRDGACHIDYCYLPARWTSRISAVHIGNKESWLQMSDHLPIIVDLNI